MISVSKAVAEYVQEKEKTWSGDRSQTVGASEVGQCARKVWATKFELEPGIGVPRDDDYVETWGARERGNMIEQHLLVPAIVKKYGDKARLLGSKQQTFVDGYASCTPDCLIVEDDGDVLIEFKSIDPRAILEEPKPEHVFQAQVQMGILNTVTPQWRPKRAIISYTNASFYNESTEFTVDYDPKVYEVAKTRATKIMTAELMSELPPEGYIAGGKECDYCPFTRACGVERRRIPAEDAATEADPQFVAEISDRAKQLKYIETSITLQEKQKREIQVEIKDRLREKGLRRIVGEGVSVSWTPVKGREGWDMPALLGAAHDAGVRVEEFSKPGEPGDRLTVTLKAKKEAA